MNARYERFPRSGFARSGLDRFAGRHAAQVLVAGVYLTEAEYESLLQLRGVHVRKTRYAVAGGALDICEQPNAGFAVFEMEFPSEEAAALYQPPGFTGQEVTRNAKHSGFTLAHQVL